MELVKTSKLPREQNRYLLTGRGGQEQIDFGYIRANGRGTLPPHRTDRQQRNFGGQKLSRLFKVFFDSLDQSRNFGFNFWNRFSNVFRPEFGFLLWYLTITRRRLVTDPFPKLSALDLALNVSNSVATA
jgi:hypothetical protein